MKIIATPSFIVIIVGVPGFIGLFEGLIYLGLGY